MRRLRFVVAAALFTSAFAGAAHAKPDDADNHFRRGVELYKDNDFAAALVEFQRAYELDPRYQVLYNVAESQFAVQDYAGALRTFQKYLYDGGNKITAKRRHDVERDIEKLRRRVAVVTVVVNEKGAQIAVDDVNVGVAPLAEPLLVSAGRRRITATLPGRPSVTQLVEVAGGDAPTVNLSIAAPDVRVVTIQRPSLVPPIVAWGATGVVTTAAVVTGVLALGASSDLKSALTAFPGNPQTISSAHGKTQALAAATDVLAALAVAGAGVSIYLTIKAQRTGALVEPTSSPPVPPPSARIVLSPAGAGVAGAF